MRIFVKKIMMQKILLTLIISTLSFAFAFAQNDLIISAVSERYETGKEGFEKTVIQPALDVAYSHTQGYMGITVFGRIRGNAGYRTGAFVSLDIVEGLTAKTHRLKIKGGFGFAFDKEPGLEGVTINGSVSYNFNRINVEGFASKNGLVNHSGQSVMLTGIKIGYLFF